MCSTSSAETWKVNCDKNFSVKKWQHWAGYMGNYCWQSRNEKQLELTGVASSLSLSWVRAILQAFRFCFLLVDKALVFMNFLNSLKNKLVPMRTAIVVKDVFQSNWDETEFSWLMLHDIAASMFKWSGERMSKKKLCFKDRGADEQPRN
jgi:hypothetical protein